jgi:hypothetical protein
LEFGVDPYTDFKPFQERLGEITRSYAATGLLTSAALSSVSEGILPDTIITVTDIAGLNELLKDNPPATLNKVNRKKPIAMGIPSYLAWTRDIVSGAKKVEDYASNQRGITGQELWVGKGSAPPQGRPWRTAAGRSGIRSVWPRKSRRRKAGASGSHRALGFDDDGPIPESSEHVQPSAQAGVRCGASHIVH